MVKFKVKKNGSVCLTIEAQQLPLLFISPANPNPLGFVVTDAGFESVPLKSWPKPLFLVSESARGAFRRSLSQSKKSGT